MAAPTALLQTLDTGNNSILPSTSESMEIDHDYRQSESADASQTTVIDSTATITPMQITTEGVPLFGPAKPVTHNTTVEIRKIPVAPHRFSPLKAQWDKIYPPLVEQLKLQVRMNIKSRAVELRTSRHTTDVRALQKGEDFVKAFAVYGFEVDDAIAMLRLDSLYISVFEIKDVKASLSGDAKSRAIARIAGQNGKTKWAIENTCKVRIVLQDTKIHILGEFQNINMAREMVVDLILGKQPGKVYQNLRTLSSKMKDRF